MRYFLIIISLIFFSLKGNATHLVGGNLGYEYIGKFGVNYRYKIMLTTYTDCAPPSNFEDGPEQTIADIGVYEHDLQNSPMGGASIKNFFGSVNMTLVLVERIDPNIPNGCNIGTGTCIDKAVYEGFIDVPLNFSGYHIFYERCCRNGTIVNLVPQESMSFHAYISPPLLGNSSPVFTDDPIPFLCAGDTTTLLNSAIDPDGDMLVFSFVQPYDAQFSSDTDPAPGPPGSLNWTINPVTYAGGYSLVQPFGAGGYTNINASTGLTTYYPPTTGDYVVAVEIKEYRNGNLIGVTRRDLQILVLSCPLNPAPNIDPTAGTTSNQFIMEEGETLCFDFGYDDPNGNSLTLSAGGAVFDVNMVNPNATIDQPITGLDAVSTEFCWTTACGQAQSLPYQFQISVMDDGCPPKTTNSVYQITVNPVAPPTSINGDPVVCQFSTDTYTTQNITNTTYNWTITGGNIIADNGSSIDIQWMTPGTGTISLIAENQFGCLSEPINQDITVTIAPNTDAGLDTTICFGDTINIVATTDALPGFSTSWTPNANMINGTTLIPDVFPTDTTKYFVLVTLGGGCFALDSVTVNVNIPFVNAGADTSICFGDSIQLNGSSSIGTTNWTPSIGLSNDAILNPFASPIVTTEYVLAVIDGFGCRMTDTMDLTIDQAFTLTTSNDTTICLGDCANLSAFGATTYAWEPVVNDSTLSNPTACPTITETYFVYGANGSCRDTAEIQVSVNLLTTVDAGLDVSICEGDSIQLNASGAIVYSWTPADSITDINIANPFVFPSNTSEYIVTGADVLGCTDSDSIILTVNPLPIIDAGEDLWVCPGDNIQLNASGVGTPIWFPTNELSDPNIYTPISTPLDTAVYVLTVTDVNLCTLTDTLTIYVNQNVPTDAGNDTTICFGDSVVIGGNPTAIDGTIYSWTPASLIVDPSVSNPNVFPSVTTTFYVITANDTCSGLDSVIVHVNLLPIIDAGNDVEICIGDSTQLLANGGTSYLWAPSITLTDEAIANPMAFPTDTTEYIVNATDINGCASSDTISVIVNTLPSPFAGNDAAICVGDTTTLTATGGLNYSWTPTNNLSNSLNAITQAFPIITTEYIATITDTNGCIQSDSILVTVNELPIGDAVADITICNGDSTQLNASGGDTYVWTPNTDLSNPNIADPWANSIVTTNYVVLITDINGCMDTDSVVVTVYSLPNISAGSDIQICIGDTTQLLVTGGDSYLWTPETGLSDDTSSNPTVTINDTTDYIVTGTDVNSCINSDTVSVIINPLPIADAGNNVNICIDDTIQLIASGGISYNWTNEAFLDDDLVFNPNATPDTTMQFIVSVTDSNTCINTDSVIVSVFIVDAISDQIICLEDSVQLDVFGSIGSAYTWTPSTYLSDPNIANPYSTAQVDITYHVSVTDVQGCSDQDSVEIMVLSVPIASFSSEIEAGCEGAVVKFTNTSIDGISFDWLFGDGGSTTIESPTYALPYGEDFTTTLTVTNSNGCVDNSTFYGTTLNFDDYFDIFIPNVFTPNGDGENDIFDLKVAGELNNCSDLKIYNRWGQIIFISTGGNTKWDGYTNVGKAVPEGTYFFVVEINGIKNSGSVALFR